MEQQHHKMAELFEQLGLASDSASIQRFIADHRPLVNGTRFFEAPFWTPSQAEFIKEKLREDSDWAVLIDNLNASMREHPDAGSLAAGVDAAPVLQGEANYAASKR